MSKHDRSHSADLGVMVGKKTLIETGKPRTKVRIENIMKIYEYLIAQLRRVIQSYQVGFDPNPARVARENVVKQLEDMRKERFLAFRKGLSEDGVLLIKILTAIDVPGLQQGIFLGDLRGNYQVVNLSEISTFTDEERRDEDGVLYDIRTLLVNPRYLRIVENVGDLVKFAERIFLKLDPEQVTPLYAWHPRMGRDLWGAIRYEFPHLCENLTRAFKGTTHPGWRWDLSEDPEVMSVEQARLSFAISASMTGMALDGIAGLMTNTVWEKDDQSKLGENVEEAFTEESVEAMGRLGNLEIGSQENSEKFVRETKHVKFRVHRGICVAESLPFGLTRVIEDRALEEGSKREMKAEQHFIRDLVAWEEALDNVQVVPALPMIQDPELKLPEPKGSCLRQGRKTELRYDLGYIADPDISDRGRIRFSHFEC